MKDKLIPIVIGVVLLVGIAVFAYNRAGTVKTEDKPPPSMPPEVAKEWSKYTQKGAGGGGSSVPGLPAGANPGRR